MPLYTHMQVYYSVSVFLVSASMYVRWTVAARLCVNKKSIWPLKKTKKKNMLWPHTNVQFYTTQESVFV